MSSPTIYLAALQLPKFLRNLGCRRGLGTAAFHSSIDQLWGVSTMGQRIAFQGEPGAYSEQAIIECFGGQAVPVAKRTFAAVFDAVLIGETDGALVPVVNSAAGAVVEVWELLQASGLLVTCQFTLPIEHCLLCLPGQTINDLRRVQSQSQALVQCEAFLASLRQRGVEIKEGYDTAGSAREIREQELYGVAAIASSRAAEIYGLTILAQGIQTRPDNVTQFLGLARDNACSLPCSIDAVPGMLASFNHHNPEDLYPAVQPG